jgi:hypothetical protein
MVVAVGNDTDFHVCTLRSQSGPRPARTSSRGNAQYPSTRGVAAYQGG